MITRIPDENEITEIRPKAIIGYINMIEKGLSDITKGKVDNKKEKKIITFEIPISMVEQLEQLEESTFLSLSGVLRMIIADYLRRQNSAKLINDLDVIDSKKGTK